MRLLAAGEDVIDVPPKLSARIRVFATGEGRKTDATDAHSVALAGTRMAGLRPVVNDAQLAVLRVLVDRRRSLGEDHTRMIPAAPTVARAHSRRREEGPLGRTGGLDLNCFACWRTCSPPIRPQRRPVGRREVRDEGLDLDPLVTLAGDKLWAHPMIVQQTRPLLVQVE